MTLRHRTRERTIRKQKIFELLEGFPKTITKFNGRKGNLIPSGGEKQSPNKFGPLIAMNSVEKGLKGERKKTWHTVLNRYPGWISNHDWKTAKQYRSVKNNY